MTAKLAEEVGCDVDEYDVTSTIDCLREKEAADLTAKEYNVQDYTANFYPFVPTVDENFLLASPAAMMKFGTIDWSIPVLIGSNANEGFWSLMYYLTDLLPNKELTDKQKTLTKGEYHKHVESIFSFYPEEVSQLELNSCRLSNLV